MPCQNNGSCESVAPVGYNCLCKYGYTSSDCSIAISFCGSNPCANGGLCVNNGNSGGYACQCLPGWSGLR